MARNFKSLWWNLDNLRNYILKDPKNLLNAIRRAAWYARDRRNECNRDNAGRIYSVLAETTVTNQVKEAQEFLLEAGVCLGRSRKIMTGAINKFVEACKRGKIDYIRTLQGIAQDERSNPLFSAMIYNVLAEQVPPSEAPAYYEQAICYYAKDWELAPIQVCLSKMGSPSKKQALQAIIEKRQSVFPCLDVLYAVFPEDEKETSRDQITLRVFKHLIHVRALQGEAYIQSIPTHFWTDLRCESRISMLFLLIKKMQAPYSADFFHFFHTVARTIGRHDIWKVSYRERQHAPSQSLVSLVTDILIDPRGSLSIESYRQWSGVLACIAKNSTDEIWQLGKRNLKAKLLNWAWEKGVEREFSFLQLEEKPAGQDQLDALSAPHTQGMPVTQLPLGEGAFFEQRAQGMILAGKYPEAGKLYLHLVSLEKDTDKNKAARYYWEAVYCFSRAWDVASVMTCLLEIVALNVEGNGSHPEPAETDILYQVVLQIDLRQKNYFLELIRCLAQLPVESIKKIPASFWLQEVEPIWCPFLLCFIVEMSKQLEDGTYLKGFQAILPSLKNKIIWETVYTYPDGEEAKWTAVGLLVFNLNRLWDQMDEPYRLKWIQCLEEIAQNNPFDIWQVRPEDSLQILETMSQEETKCKALAPLMEHIELSRRAPSNRNLHFVAGGQGSPSQAQTGLLFPFV